MRILFLANHLNTGGITSYLLTLGAGLVKEGHGVVVSSSGGDQEAKFTAAGMEVITLPLKTKCEVSPKVFISARMLSKYLAAHPVDIIHANTRVTAMVGWLLSRSCGVPFVTTCHGFFKRRIFRRMFPLWGKKVIAISDQVKEHLEKDFKVKPDRVTLVYNGIDIEKCKQKFVATDDMRRQWRIVQGPVVSIIARLSDVKGHEYLIRAFDLVVKRIPDAQLLIVGEGKTEQALHRLVGQLGIAKSVIFVRSVDDTRAVLSISDVFVMPSLQEGLGLALMEAMACGVASVASNIGGLKALIQDQKTGLLVEPKDVQALAGAIVSLLSQAELRKQFGDAGRAFIQSTFSMDIMVAETLACYRSCLRE